MRKPRIDKTLAIPGVITPLNYGETTPVEVESEVDLLLGSPSTGGVLEEVDLSLSA